MKKLLLASAVAVSMTAMIGCSNTQEKYYSAVEKAAIANSEMHKAKMEALTAMANSGDPAAQGAAVMAMALTTAPTVTPAYIESEALSWARVMATPVATVAGLAIQADVAKNASDNNAMVQMANMQSQENIQLGQQDMLVDALGVSGAGTQAAITGLVTLGESGFDALNIAGDQTSSVARTGLNATQQTAALGFDSTQAVALGSQTSLTTLATVGISEVGSVGTAGMTNLVTLGESSLTTVENITEDNNTLTSSIVSDYNQLMQQYNSAMQSIATTPAPAPTP